MSSYCGACLGDIKRNDKYVKCKGICGRFYHAKCLKFSEEIYKWLTTYENVGWWCHNCDNIKVTDILREITQLRETVQVCVDKLNSQEEVIAKLSQKTDNIVVHAETADTKSSYAEKLKTKRSEPVVVIKPKNQQTCLQTKEEVKGKLDPVQLSVKGIRNITRGGIVVECKNEEDIENIRTEAVKKLGSDYEIKVPVKKNPKVKISGLSERLSDQELIKKMIAQNEFINEESKIKIVYVSNPSRRFNTYSVIAEVDSTTFVHLVNKERINIGWDRCYVHEVHNITRCYNCSGFYHKAKECKNKLACPKCSGEHTLKDCTSSQAECINCKMAIQKLKIKVDARHEAWDLNCPVYKRKLEIERQKVNYAK